MVMVKKKNGKDGTPEKKFRKAPPQGRNLPKWTELKNDEKFEVSEQADAEKEARKGRAVGPSEEGRWTSECYSAHWNNTTGMRDMRQAFFQNFTSCIPAKTGRTTTTWKCIFLPNSARQISRTHRNRCRWRIGRRADPQ